MRETFRQRVFLALSGEAAEDLKTRTAAAAAAAAAGDAAAESSSSFLPHLSLLGAVQSRQLGDFLDGKGISRLISSDKPEAVECAVLARQQLSGSSKLLRLSQLKTAAAAAAAPAAAKQKHPSPSIKEDLELQVYHPYHRHQQQLLQQQQQQQQQHDNKTAERYADTGETTSTRSRLSSPPLKEPSILNEDETGEASRGPQGAPGGPLENTLAALRHIYEALTFQSTCGFLRVLPWPWERNAGFNAEAMHQVLSSIKRDDLAVICGTMEELRSCLDAFGSVPQDPAFTSSSSSSSSSGSSSSSSSSSVSRISPRFSLDFLHASLGLFCMRWRYSKEQQPHPFYPPGSVWLVYVERDAETLEVLSTDVKETAKTNYLSRACTHMLESKSLAAPKMALSPLSAAAVRERLRSDAEALADSTGAVPLEEAAMLAAVYGATPSTEELREWERERGGEVSLNEIPKFVEMYIHPDKVHDLAAPFAPFDKEKTGRISRLQFLTLLCLEGTEPLTEEQISSLFRLYGLSFGETVNYLEFISRVTDGCDFLSLGLMASPDAPQQQQQQQQQQQRLCRGMSCRDTLKSLLTVSSLKAFSPSTASAAAVSSPQKHFIVKKETDTGEVSVAKVLEELSKEGCPEALPQDVSFFLAEVPAAAEGLDEPLFSALKEFIQFRRQRFNEASNGLGWVHITDAAGLFEDFGFSHVPYKAECRLFQRTVGEPQLHYEDFLSFGDFVAKRRQQFDALAQSEGTVSEVSLSGCLSLARLWGFSPSLLEASSMRRQLQELRGALRGERAARPKKETEKETETETEKETDINKVSYTELIQVVSSLPHNNDRPEDLALLFRHFDQQASGFLSAPVLGRLLQAFGEPLTDSELSRFFEHYKIDAAGHVAYPELVQAVVAQ